MSVTALGVGLAAGSAVAWSILDVARKKIGEDSRATSAMAWLSLLQLPVLAPLLLIGALLSPEHQSVLFPALPSLSSAYGWRLGASIALNILANLLFLRAVQISPLSLTTPYLSFTPAFTAILAIFFYAEVPSTWGWCGIATVCLGAFFLNGGDGGGPLAALKALWKERGSLYMLGVAVIWSVTSVLDKGASEQAGALWHTAALAIALTIAFMGWRVVADGAIAPLTRELRSSPRWYVAGGLFGGAAMVLQFISYESLDIAYVETVKRAIGVLLAMAAGYWFFDERDIKRRLFAALLMVAGVAMILLGSGG